MPRLLLFLAALTLFAGCQTARPPAFEDRFPNPVDTRDRPVETIDRSIVTFPALGISVSNDFAGARFSSAEMSGDSTLSIFVAPENKPINPSPWYAFQIWSDKPRQVRAVLTFDEANHRYWPKQSTDGLTWSRLDSSMVRVSEGATWMTLDVDSDTLWIAAQEIVSSVDVAQHGMSLAEHPDVRLKTAGNSSLGRPLQVWDIYSGDVRQKDLVVIMSRQHPPEVTGYLALQAFLDGLLADSEAAKAFRSNFRLLVFPLMNPDGVDLGHWRHNAGGVDLNRDWSHNRQPETRRVAEFVDKEVASTNTRVIAGLDFHSTWYDVYYTNHDTLETDYPELKNDWLSGIERRLPGYEVDDRPSGPGRPVSKMWFYLRYGAMGVTYEIGDETPRDFIRRKGAASAESFMEAMAKTRDDRPY